MTLKGTLSTPCSMCHLLMLSDHQGFYMELHYQLCFLTYQDNFWCRLTVVHVWWPQCTIAYFQYFIVFWLNLPISIFILRFPANLSTTCFDRHYKEIVINISWGTRWGQIGLPWSPYQSCPWSDTFSWSLSLSSATAVVTGKTLAIALILEGLCKCTKAYSQFDFVCVGYNIKYLDYCIGFKSNYGLPLFNPAQSQSGCPLKRKTYLFQYSKGLLFSLSILWED